MKYLFSLILIITLNLVSFGQLTNNGATVIIKANTDVFVANNFNNTAGTLINEGNLHLQADLINDATMTLSSNANTATGVVLFNNPTATIQNILGNQPINMGNLVVNMNHANAKGVAVADGIALTVEKAVTLTNGDLRLIGESQLIQKHTLANQNSGAEKLLIDQQGTAVSFDYNYWSSPVSGATAGSYQVGEILFDGTDATLNSFTPKPVTFSSGNPWNGTVATVDGSGNVTTAVNIEKYWIWKFENGTIDDDNDWAYLANNTSINTGIGYTMKGVDAAASFGDTQNYVFKGKPNDGNYSIPFSNGKQTMVGNPYPSAINAVDFINANATVLADITTPTPTTGVLYFWEHWSGGNHYQSSYLGGYATFTLAGGTPTTALLNTGTGSGSGYTFPTDPMNYQIPVGQGFFVESSSIGGPYNIEFNNSMRVFQIEGADSHFYKNPLDTTTLTSRIRLGYHSPNNFYRQIMTAFIPACNDGHNTAYDARMTDVNAEDIYWVTNNTPYVIDARAYHIDQQIPIGISVVNDGTHTFFVDEVENFDGDIYILDTDTGFTTQINQSNFTVNLGTGVYDTRFKLVFRPSSTASTNDEEVTNAIHVFYANNNNEIVIKNSENLILTEAKIYNAIGQLIKDVPKHELTQNEIRLPFNVATGTYIVQVKTTIGKSSYKIVAY